jgi:hypothetical protein
MTYTKTNWVANVTPVTAVSMNKIETELALLDGPVGGGAIPLSTTLPGSPVDGQEVILTDSLTVPTYSWHMRYTAAVVAAQKWLFIGGSPVFGSVIASTSMAGGWAGYFPTLTAPFAGVYRVAASATITVSGAVTAVAVTYNINGAHGYVTNQGAGVCATGNALSCSMNPTPITLAAGDSVGLSAYTGTAANMTLAWLSLEPRQVG